MVDFVVEAELRENMGKSAARNLRRNGQVPAVIYGGGKQDLPMTIEYQKLNNLLNQETFHTSMVELKIKGKRGKFTGILKDVQWHPVNDQVIHVDFLHVSSADIVQVEVPVRAINDEKCPGIVQGGLVEIIRHTLEVTSRADSIPEAITVDCATLEIGDAVHVEDIDLPEGLEIHHEVNFTVLALSAPTVEVEVEDEIETDIEVGTEAEEGDEAA